MQATNERRMSLRRLDDILDALEQLNLREQKEVPPVVMARLMDVGVAKPAGRTITQLIEQIWLLQQPHMIDLMVDRRRRRRRRASDLPEAG